MDEATSRRAALAAAARDIFEAGLSAVDPRAAVAAALQRHGDVLVLSDPLRGEQRARYRLGDYHRLLVVGAGKAGAPMAGAVEDLLGDRLEGGLVIVKHGHTDRGAAKPTGASSCLVELVEAGHPLPDQAGLDATCRLIELLRGADAQTLLLCVISGGGSALLTAPAGEVSLDDLRRVTDALLAAGADIRAFNTVRKHLSALKGGQLARLAAPATVATLVLSDVIGDPLDAIASGPTVPDPTTFSAARDALRRAQIWDDDVALPSAVRAHLEAGLAGEVPETPGPRDPAFERCTTALVGNNRLAVAACERRAQQIGWPTLALTSTLEGEAADVGRMLGSIAREALEVGRPQRPPLCVICGGETTVSLGGDGHAVGRGGRNQELALAAALALDGLPPAICLLSAGTDGTDGPTDAAGALAFDDTLSRARACGLDAAAQLQDHDAYPFFDALGDLLRTGPTGTNVMDLQLLLIAEASPREGAPAR
ncbi:MAG: glycerate kinase [Proteobacteria bacterium]|nr:MAG: glycerate kinase [Pseudomonadota bacterium]